MRYFRINIYNNQYGNDYDFTNFGIDEIDNVFSEWVKMNEKYPRPKFDVSIYIMEEVEDGADDFIEDVTPRDENSKDEFIKWVKSIN